MALYTVCATTVEKTAQPCAMVEAVSDRDAAAQAETLQITKMLAFLPTRAQLSIRRASRREIEAMHAFMPVQPIKGPAARDGGLSRRAARMRYALHQKLWTGELPTA